MVTTGFFTGLSDFLAKSGSAIAGIAQTATGFIAQRDNLALQRANINVKIQQAKNDAVALSQASARPSTQPQGVSAKADTLAQNNSNMKMILIAAGGLMLVAGAYLVATR